MAQFKNRHFQFSRKESGLAKRRLIPIPIPIQCTRDQ
jgi:hypothetical protein